MKNRAVRAALFLLVLAAFAGAGYEVAILDRQASAVGAAARAFDAKALQVESGLLELRAAQFAYVATGQGNAFWTSRASTLVASIGERLHEAVELEKAALAAGLQPAGPTCAPALDELVALQRMDAGAQGYLRENQPQLASDLVFNDLREAGQVIAWRMQDARRQMATASALAAEQARRKQAATAGGAALFAVLVIVLLLPGGVSSAERLSSGEPPAGPPEPVRMIPRPPARVEPASAARSLDRRPWPGATSGETATTTAATARRRAEIDLPGAAALCSDFARVHESSQLPPLLERLTALLNAAGVVIWVHDRANDALRPALSSGYGAAALARIHSIPTSDDSVTACAYRERRLRLVEGGAGGNGAIAAPLIGAEGCVGVIAVEIRGGAERETNVQALATIVAAQLATFVAPAEHGPS